MNGLFLCILLCFSKFCQTNSLHLCYIITIAGVTSAKSAFLWKCRAVGRVGTGQRMLLNKTQQTRGKQCRRQIARRCPEPWPRGGAVRHSQRIRPHPVRLLPVGVHEPVRGHPRVRAYGRAQQRPKARAADDRDVGLPLLGGAPAFRLLYGLLGEHFLCLHDLPQQHRHGARLSQYVHCVPRPRRLQTEVPRPSRGHHASVGTVFRTSRSSTSQDTVLWDTYFELAGITIFFLSPTALHLGVTWSHLGSTQYHHGVALRCAWHFGVRDGS